ncbi:hypothetical protein HanIR_Chr05g0222211 [Helianthus annuus]|nr:hypothetical protein HanIR_Chr05g0222211 [Helianthus annuus]
MAYEALKPVTRTSHRSFRRNDIVTTCSHTLAHVWGSQHPIDLSLMPLGPYTRINGLTIIAYPFT